MTTFECYLQGSETTRLRCGEISNYEFADDCDSETTLKIG